MKYLIEARTYIFLSLFGLLALCTFCGGFYFIVRDSVAVAKQRYVSHQIADSLRTTLDSLRLGRWVQLRDGDTVVAVVRARRWKYGTPH